MAYDTGMLKDRIQILQRVIPDGKTGKASGKPRFDQIGDCIWASVTWNKGMKAMREGALDAYDTVMVRTRWNPFLTRDCFIGFEGRIYQIMSYNADRMDNTIQITAQEMVTKK